MGIFFRHPLHEVFDRVVVQISTALFWADDDVIRGLVWMSAAGARWRGIKFGYVSVVSMQVVHCSVAFKNMLCIPRAKRLRVDLCKEMMYRFPVDFVKLIGRE